MRGDPFQKKFADQIRSIPAYSSQTVKED